MINLMIWLTVIINRNNYNNMVKNCDFMSYMKHKIAVFLIICNTLIMFIDIDKTLMYIDETDNTIDLELALSIANQFGLKQDEAKKIIKGL